ncbi:hypothetical protein A3J44_04055 [candidate division WOR-1 bacterium RIFCSPHIGHO2_02_FULL_45_12]|uniref:Cytochrome c domain-containing protein n=1 Tax=candidate division WOR-1 bacterium RIFCSPLOWO2_12_FULL_45_9 TaxID=1802568 RepID=A0A1F4RQ09_UNCSA|nr:MAG: hypothetical protein A3J44_04055 [candidate division WOR-1 bacterium RIFCSPHIGHO2_02_FULL_45_12]OGC09553.1 MAG: hypothetical protein A3F86_04960 [candidate division WOR-1 bacterium RIFCSPLOWO2_12_FULL_45_9]
MKGMVLIFVGFLIMMSFAATGFAAKKEATDPLDQSIAHGKALFMDENLGANMTGTSCNSCHPGGKTTGGEIQMGKMEIYIPTLVGAAATFPKYKAGAGKVVRLDQMNNMCITMIMKGKALNLESQESVDLAAYVTSLSYGKTMQKGKTVMMKMM